MEDNQWIALIGLVILVLLVLLRIKFPGKSVSPTMTDEEREDFMDDLLFPPYSCWDDNTEDNDE